MNFHKMGNVGQCYYYKIALAILILKY